MVRDPITRDSPFQPWIVGLEKGHEGHLWVLVRVASTDWDENWDDSPDRRGLRPDLFDSILEVIDPKTARLISSKRFSEPLTGFAGEGQVYAYEEDENGQPRIMVYSYSLDSSPKRRGK